MRTLSAIYGLLASALLISCTQKAPQEVPEILHAVPTDAVMVYTADNLADALEMSLDSTDIIRKLPWGKLQKNKAAVSFVFNRRLSPVICIDAGKASEDTLESVTSLMEQIGGTGLQARYYSGKETGRRINLLLVTRSEAVFSEARRHIEAGRSIMDLQDFVSAVGMTDGCPSQIVRNSAFDQLLPGKYLDICFKRSDILRFASHFSDWIVIVPAEDGRRLVKTCQHSDESQYANVLPKLIEAESKLPEILPEDTRFAMSLPIGKGFRETYRNWRYACSNLDKYEKTLAALKKSSKIDPLKWEQRTAVHEVAMIQWGKGHKIIALRADELPQAQECCVNGARGFTAALYGSAFSSVQDSCCIRRGSWLICGSKPDIESFPEPAPCPNPFPGWPQSPCKFVISHDGRIMYADSKEMIIDKCAPL